MKASQPQVTIGSQASLFLVPMRHLPSARWKRWHEIADMNLLKITGTFINNKHL